MNGSLENESLRWVLYPAQSRWNLYDREGSALVVENTTMRVDYRLGGRRFRALEHWHERTISESQVPDSPHGPLRRIDLAVGPDANGLTCTLTFALPANRALFLWRAAVDNQGNDPVYLGRITLLDAAILGADMGDPAFFSNGWGSWNYTGAYGPGDRYRRTRLGPFRAPVQVNAGTPQPRSRGHIASDMFGVLGDRRSRTALLAGFISQMNHFGSLETRLDSRRLRLRMWANGDGARLDPGESITTDWACLHFLEVDSPDPLAPYLEAVASETPPRRISPESPAGWCSWYQYYQDISQEIIQRNLETAAALRVALPLDVIQIDDGFQTRAGDWFNFTPGFPEGLAPLAREIKERGFTPGLWLAPFIVERGSELAKEHPEWLLRGRLNQPANAGFIWDRFPTALDLTHPEALDYVKDVMRAAVHDWGFQYLKLDFLYAAALPGRYRDPRRTRAQVLRAGLEALREAAGEDAFLLGCGCPLGPALGLVDAMRVGTDVAPTWRPVYPVIQPYFQQEPDIPSTRNAIQNALTRLPLHNRWWTNDPDCLLLRPETSLSLAEVRSLATVIALSAGILSISDDLPALPPERLRIAQALLPLLEEPARVLDWFDELTPRRLRLDLAGAAGAWTLLALFNWDNAPRPERIHLEQYGLAPGETYFGREFWRGESTLVRDGSIDLGRLPAHGVALLALRRCSPGEPLYLGSDLHISQGLEVRRWDWDNEVGAVWIELERPGQARGMVEVYLPRPLKAAVLDGRPLTWRPRGHGCYQIAVSFVGEAQIQVSY